MLRFSDSPLFFIRRRWGALNLRAAGLEFGLGGASRARPPMRDTRGNIARYLCPPSSAHVGGSAREHYASRNSRGGLIPRRILGRNRRHARSWPGALSRATRIMRRHCVAGELLPRRTLDPLFAVVGGLADSRIPPTRVESGMDREAAAPGRGTPPRYLSIAAHFVRDPRMRQIRRRPARICLRDSRRSSPRVKLFRILLRAGLGFVRIPRARARAVR